MTDWRILLGYTLGGLEGLPASLCEAGFRHVDILTKFGKLKFFLILMSFFFIFTPRWSKEKIMRSYCAIIVLFVHFLKRFKVRKMLKNPFN